MTTDTTDAEAIARNAVKRIIDDLTDRRGLRHAWDGIDDDIRAEIESAWTMIIRTSLASRREVEPDVPEPVYKAVERILDEKSAWVARPNDEITKSIAFQAVVAAHKIIAVCDGEEPEYIYDDERFNKGVQHVVDMLARNLGVTDWVAGDGSESYDEDLWQTVLNILAAKGLYDPGSGEFASCRETPTPASKPVAWMSETDPAQPFVKMYQKDEMRPEVAERYSTALYTAPPAPASEVIEALGKRLDELTDLINANRDLSVRINSKVVLERDKVRAFVLPVLNSLPLDGEVERMRAAIKRQVENIDRWRETGEPASPEESKSIYEQLVAALDGCCHD